MTDIDHDDRTQPVRIRFEKIRKDYSGSFDESGTTRILLKIERHSIQASLARTPASVPGREYLGPDVFRNIRSAIGLLQGRSCNENLRRYVIRFPQLPELPLCMPPKLQYQCPIENGKVRMADIRNDHRRKLLHGTYTRFHFVRENGRPD